MAHGQGARTEAVQVDRYGGFLSKRGVSGLEILEAPGWVTSYVFMNKIWVLFTFYIHIHILKTHQRINV